MPEALWTERLAVLRLGPSDRRYEAMRVEIDAELTKAAARDPKLRDWKRALGDGVVDDAVREVIHGRPRKRNAPPTLAGTTAAQRVALSGWHAGLLDRLECTPVDDPPSYFRKMLRTRLVDAKREARLADGLDEEAGLGSGAGSLDLDPYSVPRDVARTLSDAASFARIALALIPRCSPSHPLRAAVDEPDTRLQRQVVEWALLATFLREDMARGKDRQRWAPGIKPAADNHSRAWQATYYQYEGLDDHWDPSERPEHKAHPTEATLAYQHLSRFRQSFGRAAQTASGIVAGGEAVRATDRKGRALLPSEWDAADHPTLEAAEKR